MEIDDQMIEVINLEMETRNEVHQIGDRRLGINGAHRIGDRRLGINGETVGEVVVGAQHHPRNDWPNNSGDTLFKINFSAFLTAILHDDR